MGLEFATIRPYTHADENHVLEVVRRCYDDRQIADAFRWRHFDIGFTDSSSVVAEVNGQIVGIQPLEFFPFDMGGRLVTGGVLSGVMVHPDFRRRGLFRGMVEECETQAWGRNAFFVMTLPNDRSFPGFIKMGYTDLGRRDLFVCALDPVVLGASLFRPAILGRVLGFVALPLAKFFFKGAPLKVGVTCVTTTDPAIELLLGSQHYGSLHGLKLSRSLDWWNWRYLHSPVRKYGFCEAWDETGALMAVAVGATLRYGNRLVGFLMDVCGGSEDHQACACIGMMEKFRTDGVSAVASVVSSPTMRRILRRSGLVRVPRWFPLKKFHTVVRWNPRSVCEMPEHVKRVDGWHLTLGDWDNL